MVTEGMDDVLLMASKADNLLTNVKFVTANGTDLALLGKTQTFVDAGQIFAEPCKQSLSNDNSFLVHRFLLCLLLSLVILSFLDNSLEFGVLGKLFCSILLMLLRFFNVINVLVADEVIFKLLFVTEFRVLFTAHRKD